MVSRNLTSKFMMERNSLNFDSNNSQRVSDKLTELYIQFQNTEKSIEREIIILEDMRRSRIFVTFSEDEDQKDERIKNQFNKVKTSINDHISSLEKFSKMNLNRTERDNIFRAKMNIVEKFLIRIKTNYQHSYEIPETKIDKIFNEQLQMLNTNVDEREIEINKICNDIREINIIFKRLHSIVIEQGSILDNIERNLDDAVYNVKSGNDNLISADNYQKKNLSTKVAIGLTFLIGVFTTALCIKIIEK